ncbi:bifunctional indole-3-glycerol-phosphate synthase TrpC/phosphoribosylanthranilate isomerase TrpF [Motilimonas sp. 1_MG-2023]|uniref:bifunctional indole-3-glycerol-phosphate synthase TrpC/phosphoribosylanthranilate isomerase TrpF n=1 Tax=Motilimonas sp. 1_MG-2023 TaxID=3062672 RepID=UPI0026E47A21|nr:bifunctional indole-3-glycerol-phosphate synthase TrpC/phosphoribosylanthranilate isomerase TrpF [Motilimonas sp. 1_MG-2023]MDO6528028.1 bifunctional indole-3-glycerol-phosphate synthase TrpC/phosphoribosylanthranilate isomerase TrpF [Motilimonas sp. 1_MG-2023]
MLMQSELENTILGKIIDDKKVWVEARKASQPLAEFEHLLTPTERDFYAALEAPGTHFILECKKASPSKGLIRENFDLDLIASAYKNHASAISVLTDEKYFQGQFDYVTQVRNQVTQPVICKDFVIDAYQIKLARLYQADAVLLMLSVLSDEEYIALAKVAHSYNMGILTEVSNEQEMTRALALDVRIYGINNRNLRDLSTDLNRTKVLSPLVPEGKVVICESGIYHHDQVKDLRHFAKGFLVGSSIMSQDNVELACRKLILGNNKVCGLTSATDAANVYSAGAVLGGLIFVEKSPRCVNLEQAKAIMTGAPLEYVGVFQSHDVNAVAEHAKALGLNAVQLHGDEDQAYIATLRPLLPAGCAIWKAIGIDGSEPQLCPTADMQLFDTRTAAQSGGTGQAFDWQILAKQNKSNLMLAGGITPENAQHAAHQDCLGLDLNSGVESAPGIKDKQKLDSAFAAIRQY